MAEYEIVPQKRKGRILSPARFGCLDSIPTLNVTNGCMFRCAYCYARGYGQSPEEGTIQLYVNLPALLKHELSRRRVLPDWVAVNTASDCFQPHPDILQITREVLEILLRHGIGISLLTKGLVSPPVLDLFRQHPDKVFVQIGIVSLSRGYWAAYEPGAPAPEERLNNIGALKKIGILPEIRIDPMIPFVTDTKAEMARLLGALADLSIRRVSLSYLHMRPAIYEQLSRELSPTDRAVVQACFANRKWETVGASTRTKLLPKPIRERGYAEMKAAAKQFGISVSVCRCKNPDLESSVCGAGVVKPFAGRKESFQLPLFQC